MPRRGVSAARALSRGVRLDERIRLSALLPGC
jgi:hypothetical protein